jgi:hypothetical protein
MCTIYVPHMYRIHSLNSDCVVVKRSVMYRMTPSPSCKAWFGSAMGRPMCGDKVWARGMSVVGRATRQQGRHQPSMVEEGGERRQ